MSMIIDSLEELQDKVNDIITQLSNGDEEVTSEAAYKYFESKYVERKDLDEFLSYKPATYHIHFPNSRFVIPRLRVAVRLFEVDLKQLGLERILNSLK